MTEVVISLNSINSEHPLQKKLAVIRPENAFKYDGKLYLRMDEGRHFFRAIRNDSNAIESFDKNTLVDDMGPAEGVITDGVVSIILKEQLIRLWDLNLGHAFFFEDGITLCYKIRNASNGVLYYRNEASILNISEGSSGLLVRDMGYAHFGVKE